MPSHIVDIERMTPLPAVLRRVVKPRANIKTDKEEREVKSQSQSVGARELLIELGEVELSALLCLIAVYGPDIAGIDERRSLEYPEEFETVLEVEVQLYVAGLVEVGASACGLVDARSERADRPSAHAVGSAGVEALLERHDVGIAVRIGQSHAYVVNERVLVVDHLVVRIAELALDVLRVAYVEDSPRAVVLLDSGEAAYT